MKKITKKRKPKNELRILIEKNFNTFEKNQVFKNSPKDKKLVLDQIEAMSKASNDLIEKNNKITTGHLFYAMLFMYQVALNQMKTENKPKTPQKIEPEKTPVLSYEEQKEPEVPLSYAKELQNLHRGMSEYGI